MEWKKVGPHTVLGKNFYAGLATFGDEKVQEVTTHFDYLKINLL
jgi:hypothetical protein